MNLFCLQNFINNLKVFNMNIFVVDENPKIAAQMLCDKHVNKMLLESCQIMATVLNKHSIKTTYKPTHQNHPCTLWAVKSKQNFEWLKSHALALAQEYTHRYKKIHKCEQYIHNEYECPETIESIGLTQFAQAMPDEYKDVDPIKAYRKYYIGAKKEFARWTNRSIPSWFN